VERGCGTSEAVGNEAGERATECLRSDFSSSFFWVGHIHYLIRMCIAHSLVSKTS
jgi:hypothetical protein